jgi:hypothetical protein
MLITSCGRGVHQRELKGVEYLSSSLPDPWYGFSNLDLVLDLGRAREVDLVLVADHRIFLVDLKDWHGEIESRDGHWFLNGRDMDASPVAKVTGIARDLAPMLKDALRKHQETRALIPPRIEGVVVLTAGADFRKVAESEKAKVLTDRDFVRRIATPQAQRNAFGNVAEQFLKQPLTERLWRTRLRHFFNAGPSSPFKPGRRRFQQFVADDGAAFVHPLDIYREYAAQEEGVAHSLGTLRLWNFDKCPDGRFRTAEGRSEIAGRERAVYHWLKDRGDDVDRVLLSPLQEDSERGVQYWEIYDRRTRLKRLKEFCATEKLDVNQRIELSRQLLLAVASLHRNESAHLDLGQHSIWLEAPTTVRLSHLLAARFPQLHSLGESRYQFLASVRVPEDLLGGDGGPMRRDIFLAGVAIHQLLFGAIPAGDPPEWNPAVDAQSKLSPLHHWFAQALELDAGMRFADAAVALEAFNLATATRPTPEEAIRSLEHFRSEFRSQRALASAYPAVGDVVETDRMEMWRSEFDGAPALVKMWKPGAWGDLRREAPRILAFLETAASLKVDRPAGLASIRAAHWLGDAIVVVQEFIEGPTLASLIETRTGLGDGPAQILQFVRSLFVTVERLHEIDYAHGDLKPDNIVVSAEGGPTLIDPIDFAPAADGEISTTAYAPPFGNRFERDRFALLRIAEEILDGSGLDDEDARPLALAIETCRDKVPQLASLQPVMEAIDLVTKRIEDRDAGEAPGSGAQVLVCAVGAEVGPISPDEGEFFVRYLDDRQRAMRTISLRGSIEELEIRLDRDGKPTSVRRRNIDQRRIGQISKYEFYKFKGEVRVERSDINEFTGLASLLAVPEVSSRLAGSEAGVGGAVEAGPADDAVDGPAEEVAEDLLSEEISALPDVELPKIDIRRLWRTLIQTEKEFTTEGIAQRDSTFDSASGRHRVPFELDSGVFDFSLSDRVGVEKQDRRAAWRRIGALDLAKSRPDLAIIIALEGRRPFKSALVGAGDRLRFVSHFEVQSLRRRSDAVDRILAGNGRSADLLSVFDPQSDARPVDLGIKVVRDDLAPYELNDEQIEAFERIVRSRPVGLLQGPPGTGKTRFIAGLAHYAISKKLARNVLLSSQSHEAVNTAAEAVLKLFRASDQKASILRVAMKEDVVSDALQPFHTTQIEQAMKDRFRATFERRLAIIADVLAIPRVMVKVVANIEQEIRPIVGRLGEFARKGDVKSPRYLGLVETLKARLDALDADGLSPRADDLWEGYMSEVIESVTNAYAGRLSVNASDLARLFSGAALGSDFMGSVSRAGRSFEPFLAGTRQIVAGTCVGLGRTSLGLTSTPFDLVIVDEAARCTSSELLVPLQAARWAVLVGDHAQLEPHHEVEIVNRVAAVTGLDKREVRRSDFERVFTTEYGKHAGTSLKRQYRMLPPIGRLVSEVFYGDLKLEPGRSDPEIEPSCLPPDLDRPLLWVDTDRLGNEGFERATSEGFSRINQAEANAIVALLERWLAHDKFSDWLSGQTKHDAGIGIICMYSAQRDLIRRILMRSAFGNLVGHHIRVGTVDSYQGKQNPITIVSLVRNNVDGPWEDGRKTIREGFLSTPNRINVAVSRAMDGLVVVGARSRWRQDGPIGRMSDVFQNIVDDGLARVVNADSMLDVEQLRTKTKSKKTAGRGRSPS